MMQLRTPSYSPARTRGGTSGTVPFAALLSVVMVVELAAAWLAYHTIGEVVSGMLSLAVGLNVVPVVLFIVRRQSLAVIAALLLFVAIVPYQALLGHTLLALNDEAGSVVAHLYEARLRTGEYPADLSSYAFRDPGLRPHFQEYRRDAERGGFVLLWYVGTPSTPHSYTPRDGWGYYPD